MTERLQWSVNLNPTRLGADGDWGAIARRADLAREHLQDLGVGFVRVDLRWAQLFPGPGKVDEQAVAWYRRFLRDLARDGLQVYGILYNPPAWACDLARFDLAGFHGAWREYVRACAHHFGDLVRVWQVWNEPNNYVSHLKDDFNLFHVKTFGVGGWKITLPVAVRWEALVPLFRVARQELGPDAFLAYNAIASVSDFTPVSLPNWTEWDHFTDRLLELAGDSIDAIALDHYPDTWTPGVGPLAWEPLDLLYRKVHDPRTAWYGKTVIVGEFGYSSCPNVDLVKRPARLTFFPEDHSEDGMRDWYAQAVPHLAQQLHPSRWAHNRLHLANLYELYDPEPGHILGGEHLEVVGIEYHFGLLRPDHSPKPAYEWLRDYWRGDHAPIEVGKKKGPTHPLGLYMKGSAASKAVHRRVSPMVYGLYQALRPPLRRHDAGVLSMGAVLVLYNLWRAATRGASK